MDYQMFKEQLAALLKRKAGDDFEVKVESVQKLNGIEKEAFVISRKKDWIAPTIYVELLYECCLQGVPLSQIAEKILEPTIPHLSKTLPVLISKNLRQTKKYHAGDQDGIWKIHLNEYLQIDNTCYQNHSLHDQRNFPYYVLVYMNSYHS